MKALMYKYVIDNKLNILIGTLFVIYMAIANQAFFIYLIAMQQVTNRKYIAAFGFSPKQLIRFELIIALANSFYYISIILFTNIAFYIFPIDLPIYDGFNIYKTIIIINLIILIVSIYSVLGISSLVYNKVYRWIIGGSLAVLAIVFLTIIAYNENIIVNSYPLEIFVYSTVCLLAIMCVGTFITWIFMEKFDDVKY